MQAGIGVAHHDEECEHPGAQDGHALPQEAGAVAKVCRQEVLKQNGSWQGRTQDKFARCGIG